MLPNMSTTGYGALPRVPTYRVDLDAHVGSDIGGHQRRDLAAVVHTVREQDYNLALGIALAQAVDRRGQTVAYGRTVLDDAAAYARKHRLQRTLVGRQGTLREGLARKYDQSQTVTVAVGDEASRHLLGRRDAVGLEVARQHRTRDVDHKHDVDTLGARTTLLVDILRARQRHNQQHKGRTPQHEGRMPQPIAQRTRRAAYPLDRRDAYGRAPPCSVR